MTARLLLAAAWIASGTCPCLALAGPALTNIAAIHDLTSDALSNGPPVRISGILTAQEPGGCSYLQDQGLGIRLTLATNTPTLEPGARVTVEGFAGLDPCGLHVRPTRVTQAGHGPLPDAKATSIGSILQTDNQALRVRLEGIITGVSPGNRSAPDAPPELFVILSTANHRVELCIQGRSHDARMASLLGSFAWATGVTTPVATPQGELIGWRVLVTPADALVPGEPGHGIPQARPLVPIRELLRSRHASSPIAPVRIRGVVTATPTPFFAFVEDDATGILIRFAPVPCQAKPGDQIIAEGFAVAGHLPAFGPGLGTFPVTFEAYRSEITGTNTPPKGPPIDNRKLLDLAMNFRRVTAEGIVRAYTRDGVTRDVRISVQCGGTYVDVVSTHYSIRSSPSPRINSQVRVTGVLDQRTQQDKPYDSVRLYLADTRDIVEIAPPPRDTTRDLAMAAVPASALALLAFGWAFALRRAVTRRTSELAKANQSLALANRARADFLAHMSHEVRTPVHAMNGLLQLLGRQPLADQPKALVHRLATTSRSLTQIVNDALDLSKVDAGQLDLDPQPFHPNGPLDHIDGLFAPLARDKGLAWSVERLPDDAPWLVGDSFRLEQVLSNLASNAVKFTRHGRVRIHASLGPVTTSQPAGAPSLCLECEDTGCGMAPDVLSRLFQPYVQADASIPRTHGGTGLGLAIARRLVEMMGGTLHAESQPGVGTRFQVVVPLPVHARFGGDAPARPEPPHASLPQGHRLSGRRILVADDDPTNRSILEAAIEQEHGCTLLVPDGLAALQAIESDPSGFDAVVMDLLMPVMDGHEAIRRIRAIPGCEGLPILACSAGLRAAKRSAALAAGATDFLSKPFDLEDVVLVLTHHLRPRQGEATATPPSAHHALQAALVASHEADAVTARWPEIEGVDAREAARRFSGSPGVFLRGLDRFHAEFSAFEVVLQRHLRDRHSEDLARSLHGLAGAAAMLGARAVAAAAADLEQRLHAEGPAHAMPPWDTFRPLLDELGRLLRAIESHRAGSDASEPAARPATTTVP